MTKKEIKNVLAKHKAWLAGDGGERADLCDANLRGADLRDADLRGADLEYSTWPLWCGSLDVKIDKRIAAQLLYHSIRAMQSCADDPDVAAVLASEPCLRLANQFHRAEECGRIEPPQEGARSEVRDTHPRSAHRRHRRRAHVALALPVVLAIEARTEEDL